MRLALGFYITLCLSSCSFLSNKKPLSGCGVRLADAAVSPAVAIPREFTDVKTVRENDLYQSVIRYQMNHPDQPVEIMLLKDLGIPQQTLKSLQKIDVITVGDLERAADQILGLRLGHLMMRDLEITLLALDRDPRKFEPKFRPAPSNDRELVRALSAPIEDLDLTWTVVKELRELHVFNVYDLVDAYGPEFESKLKAQTRGQLRRALRLYSIVEFELSDQVRRAVLKKLKAQPAA